MDDLIRRADALTEVEIIADGYWHHEVIRKAHKLLMQNIKAIPAVDAVTLPCKIGDAVWAISTQFGRCVAMEGRVSQMYFGENMELVICVNRLARGLWGERVFATKEDCEAAIRQPNDFCSFGTKEKK